MSTEVLPAEAIPAPVGPAYVSAADRIQAASDVATRFNDIVKKQRMSRRIGQNDHIQIEAWQTIGSLTGVFTNEAGNGQVTELPWPELGAIPDRPDDPGNEPRNKQSKQHREWKAAQAAYDAWEMAVKLHAARDLGKTFGYKVAFVATKDGHPIGWGEGRCTRNETRGDWINSDDYALASMAQTRGQSRALSAPLKWIVKLAGYEGTPAEEMTPDNDEDLQRLAAEVEDLRSQLADAPKWGPVADEPLEDEALVALITLLGEETNPARFLATLANKLNGIPEAVARSFKLAAWYSEHPEVHRGRRKTKLPDDETTNSDGDTAALEGGQS